MAVTDETNETPTPPIFNSLEEVDAWLAARGLTLRMEPTEQEQAWLEDQRELARQICAVFGIEVSSDAQARA